MPLRIVGISGVKLPLRLFTGDMHDTSVRGEHTGRPPGHGETTRPLDLPGKLVPAPETQRTTERSGVHVPGEAAALLGKCGGACCHWKCQHLHGDQEA